MKNPKASESKKKTLKLKRLTLRTLEGKTCRLQTSSKKYEGQAQIVEKEKKHYQGLPEDLTPIAGKVGASAAEKRK